MKTSEIEVTLGDGGAAGVPLFGRRWADVLPLQLADGTRGGNRWFLCVRDFVWLLPRVCCVSRQAGGWLGSDLYPGKPFALLEGPFS